MKTGVSWVACLLAMAVPLTAAGGPAPVEPPAPPWTEFVKTDGHANEIPAGWIATEEGRFAHSIVLPDSVPKAVPFDFGAARIKALTGSKTVRRLYWEHLCSTEAGSFVLRAVDAVEGFFFMRPVGGINDQQNSDRWKLEAPGLQASWGWRYEPESEAIGFVQPPSATYDWVDFPAPPPKSGVLHLHDYQDSTRKLKVDYETESAARYGITWRGVHRQFDRENAISGVEWIAFDRHSREVLGVLRDFYATGSIRNRPGGISWLNAGRCPFKRERWGRVGEVNAVAVWAPEVLRPKVYPGILKFLDEQRARTTK